jgi:hypothetical protein
LMYRASLIISISFKHTISSSQFLLLFPGHLTHIPGGLNDGIRQLENEEARRPL